MKNSKGLVSVLLAFMMLVTLATVVSAQQVPSLAETLPQPKFVTLKGINNELFTVIEEVDKFYNGETMPTVAQSKTRWAQTPVDTVNSSPDKTVNNLGEPIVVEHKYYDGYTARDIHNMCFESTETTESYYQIYFSKKAKNSPLYWGGNTYYNFGYIQIFHDIEEVYFACYNPFTNTLYRYPAPMSSINDDGTALLQDGDKVYKVQFKPTVISVLYDGKRIGFDQLPVIENGRTLVPLRAIFEKIGATVEWDGDTQTVTATKGDVTVSLTINNTTATKNGQAITLDVPAKIINGRTLVPVRFVSDCFGVGVDWNGDIQSVILTSK